MDANFEFEGLTPEEVADRLRELDQEITREIEDIAEQIALRIVADAKRNAPVDTGRLRASINFDVGRADQYSVRIAVGSNVEYSIYQEVDNPYLRPAIDENRDTIRRLIEEAVETAVNNQL